MYLAYALTNLFASFFLANTSYLYGSPKISCVRYLYLYLNTSKSKQMSKYLYFT